MRDFEDSTLDTHDVPPQAQACLRLWAAKLVLHAKDYAAGKRELKKTKGRVRPDVVQNALIAQDWIDSDSNEIGSFNWVCRLFEIDPERARSTVYYGWRYVLNKETLHG